MMRSNQGSTLIETLIAITIFAIIATGFISATFALGMSELRTRIRTEAAQLARENIEIVYNLSVQDWNSLIQLEGEYHTTLNSQGFFELTEGREILDSAVPFSRYLLIEPLTRDTFGDLVTVEDDEVVNMVRVESIVSWETGNQEEISYRLYLTNFDLENL